MIGLMGGLHSHVVAVPPGSRKRHLCPKKRCEVVSTSLTLRLLRYEFNVFCRCRVWQIMFVILIEVKR